ncbi:MAG: hypothetical protein NC095_06360 [Muribaculum sp.]|nr:hypothetical protein [Muribaculum sp.]
MTDRHYHHILEYFRGVTKCTKWEGHLYAVGGCVRDEILGSEIHDVDIAVDIPNGGILFTRWLMRRRQLAEMPIFFHKFGTAKLRLRRFPDDEIELVQTRAEQYTDKTSRCPEVVSGNIEQDCFRRDFTVNTLYRNISTGEILDMTGSAVHDIKEGILRTPMDPYETFDDDPVRILRCLRFAARFGWEIEHTTQEALQACVSRLAIVSRERWASEFKKMLFGRNARRSLGELARIDGFKYMNPLIREMSAKYPYDGDKSVLEMGIEDAARLEEEGVDDPARRLAAFFGYDGMLRAGVRDKNGAIRYPRHELTGASMTAKFLKHIKIDRNVANAAVAIMKEKGEKRRIAERESKIAAQARKQHELQEARLARKQERAEKHRKLMEEQQSRPKKKRRRKKRKPKEPE